MTRLRARLAEVEETFRAIRAGEVDAVVIPGQDGPRVFTLQGAERAYRVLIESMNEGALTLTPDKTILYANECFARMVKQPRSKVVGHSLRSFLSAADRAALRLILKRRDKSGSKIPVLLRARDGSQVPAQISIRPLAPAACSSAIIGMVVTDMTEARHKEEMLRALSHRLVQNQEAERGRVALELHDHITQLLCAVIFRSQALAEKLSARDGPLKTEATKLREMLGTTTEEVERISRGLHPSVLDHLGLSAVLRAATTEFAQRTGLSVQLTGAELSVRLPANAELTLYRILQQALRNVEKHAHAHHVAVDLTLQKTLVRLTITDDGVGFDPDCRQPGRDRMGAVGLFGMRERAAYLGGALHVTSTPGTGTQVEVLVSVPRAAAPRKTAGKVRLSPGKHSSARK